MLCCIHNRSTEIAPKEEKRIYSLPRTPVFMDGEVEYKDDLRKPGRPVILECDATVAVFDNPVFAETPVRVLLRRRSPPPYCSPVPIEAECIDLDRTSLPSDKPSSSSDYSSFNSSESTSVPSTSVESPTYRLPPPLPMDVTFSSQL